MTTRRLASPCAALSLALWWSSTVIFAQAPAITPQELSDTGWAEVEAGRFGDALVAFDAARELAPREPSLWLGSGLSAYMLGRDAEAQQWLEHALRLDATLVDASRVLGELHHRAGRVADAVAVYEEALRHTPGDPYLAQKLEAWRSESQLHDRFYQTRAARFRVLFEGPTDDALGRQIVQILERAYRDVGSALRTYPTQVITVVLYTEQQFQDVTRSPGWAAGAYDGQIRVPVRGALRADRRAELERVLTHEYVHALVAQLGGRAVPVWINEGLSTVFEPGGLDRASSVMRRAGARPPLSALHGGFGGLAGASAAIAYSLSALAVDRMISLRGASAVVLLLNDLAAGQPFESAFHQRVGVRYDEFERMARNFR